MKYVVLGALGLVTIIHLVGLFLRNYKIKAITKPLLIPLILGYYLLATQQINWIIFAALACGWVGDIILLIRTRKGMVTGAGFFLIEQILLILGIALMVNFSKVNLALLICVPLIYIAVSIGYHFTFIHQYEKGKVFCLSCLYLSANGLASAFAFFNMLSHAGLNSAILYAGTTLFFISDAILIYSRLTKKTNLDPKHVFIMFTYILAQFAIVLSFIV